MTSTEKLAAKIATATRIAQVDELALKLGKEFLFQKMIEEAMAETERIISAAIEGHPQNRE